MNQFGKKIPKRRDVLLNPMSAIKDRSVNISKSPSTVTSTSSFSSPSPTGFGKTDICPRCMGGGGLESSGGCSRCDGTGFIIK